MKLKLASLSVSVLLCSTLAYAAIVTTFSEPGDIPVKPASSNWTQTLDDERDEATAPAVQGGLNVDCAEVDILITYVLLTQYQNMIDTACSSVPAGILADHQDVLDDLLGPGADDLNDDVDTIIIDPDWEDAFDATVIGDGWVIGDFGPSSPANAILEYDTAQGFNEVLETESDDLCADIKSWNSLIQWYIDDLQTELDFYCGGRQGGGGPSP